MRSGSSSFDLGVTVDPIFADGAAKLRSRAAPSARIEPQVLYLTEHELDSAMFGSLTSPKRERVNTLRLIPSLAFRACILNGFHEHGAVQLVPISRSALAPGFWRTDRTNRTLTRSG